MPLIIIYGDGSRERRLVPAIARKLGFTKDYAEPQIPGPTIGLGAAVDAIAALLDMKAAPRYYLIVIDKEHVPREHAIREELEKRGFTSIHVEPVHQDYAWRISCKRGAKETTIYIAAMGTQRAPHIEGNLSKLILLAYGEHVEPTKEAIKNWLKERGKRDKDLVEEAPKNKVEEAFKPLAETLATITREDP